MLRQRLQNAHPALFTLVAMTAAFCTYSCMYAFRKPFTAAAYTDGPVLLGLTYKSVLVIAQVLGYMFSKFVGIKVVSEMRSSQRVPGILILIGVAELALLGFGAVPAPWNIGFLFLNGIPLGMVWGLVFSFLEGRKNTEVMGLGLCASFIFASGIVKDAGAAFMRAGVSEYWMPFVTGLAFLPLLLLSVWVLSQVPPPSIEDEALRTPRRPMTGPERVAFFRRFAPGLIILILSYMFLTAYRDFRDNFLADIWSDLRSGGAHPEFSQTETPIALAVLGVLMLIALVKKNIRALMVNHIAVGVGPLLAGIAAFCFQQGWISDFMLILITGFGAYIAYIPFNSILFERMIATFKYVSNVGFLMYLSDAFGYLGSVGVLVYKNVGAKGLSWTQFFINASYIAALTGCVGALAAWLYFRREHQREEAKQLEPVADL